MEPDKTRHFNSLVWSGSVRFGLWESRHVCGTLTDADPEQTLNS